MSQNFEQFGKFILLEKLASGGMAEVFLAKSMGASGVNKFLAIKRILPQYSDNKEFIDMFKEEAKIAVNLNHGSVVSIYEFGMERGQFYLVMEYVEGRNLRQILNELRKKSLQFSIEQIVYMVKEVAAGLDHAHRLIDGTTGRPLNLVHRDMSPQNVMVSFEGEVKVIDFGIAKAESQLEATKAGTLKGKFGYMSPEQADGLSIDARTDLFSLGIVLWEMLANDRLFTSNSEAAILRKIRECQIPSIRKINPSIPAELENIVNKALAKDKNHRYQTAAAFHKDLNRFLNMEYPDFSSQDFAVFIKNAFADVYADNKKKLVQYANVSGGNDEKTVITQTVTYTPDSSTSSSEPPSSPSITGLPPVPHNSEEDLNLIHQSNHKVELNNLGGPKKIPAAATQSGTSITASRPGVRPTNPMGTRTNITITKSKPKSNDWSAPALIIIAALAGGYIYLKQPQLLKGTFSNTAKTSVRGSASEKTPLTEGNTDIAATGQVTVTVNSEPLGAEIFIDGHRYPSKTPAQVQIPANKPVVIRLEKPEHLPFEKTIRASESGQTFNSNLQAIASTGALNLSLVNGGAQPEIEINGQKVNQPPPLKNYRVPAGVPVVIKVRNSFLGLKAEKTISVGASESKHIELILKPEKSSP